MKLIKLKNDHYIIVDDSEIKEGDWMIRDGEQPTLVTPNFWWDFGVPYKKITHSTQPLEKEKITNPTTQIVREAMKIVSKDVIAPKVVRNGLVKPTITLLSLQEVKELLGEVDVDNIVDELSEKPHYTHSSQQEWFKIGAYSGYNQALEDNKERKYTEEGMIEWAMCMIAQYVHGNTNIWNKDLLRESLPKPKTEWDVEFVDGKLKLK